MGDMGSASGFRDLRYLRPNSKHLNTRDRLKLMRTMRIGEREINNTFSGSTCSCTIPAWKRAISASMTLASKSRRSGSGGRSRKRIGYLSKSSNNSGGTLGSVTPCGAQDHVQHAFATDMLEEDQAYVSMKAA